MYANSWCYHARNARDFRSKLWKFRTANREPRDFQSGPAVDETSWRLAIYFGFDLDFGLLFSLFCFCFCCCFCCSALLAHACAKRGNKSARVMAGGWWGWQVKKSYYRLFLFKCCFYFLLFFVLRHRCERAAFAN